MGRGSLCLVLGQNTGKLASENPPLHPATSSPFPSTASHFHAPLIHHASHAPLVGMARWAEQQATGPRLDDEAWRLGTEEQTQETDRG